MYACEDGRGIIIPEAMVFGASGVGKRAKVRGVGDGVGGAGKRPQGERHGERMLKKEEKKNVLA